MEIDREMLDDGTTFWSKRKGFGLVEIMVTSPPGGMTQTYNWRPENKGQWYADIDSPAALLMWFANQCPEPMTVDPNERLLMALDALTAAVSMLAHEVRGLVESRDDS